MVQVKIIRSNANLIEGKINEWLYQLGSTPGYTVKLYDIKLYHIPEKDIDTVMIIFNQTKITQTPI